MITLRDYQENAITKILEAYDAGQCRQLLVMATGTGKTETALGVWQAEVARGEFGRGLIISHRHELVHQPVQRIRDNWPGLPMPGVVKADENNPSAPIVSASIQTLWSGDGRRLDEILRAGTLTHVWVDETHRVQAKTYQKTLARIFEACPGVRLLGTTATPNRTDGDGLRATFDSVAYRVSIKDAIDMGAICAFDAFAARLDKDEFDFSDVRTNAAGDYAEEATGKILSLPEAEKIIIEKWREVAGDRPTIAFTASVAQAHSLADAFRREGVIAEAIDGTSAQAHREKVTTAFRDATPWAKDGRPIQVLVGCMIFVEGFDAPRASCALMARPTQSDLTYIQAIGRALRWHDKTAGLADDQGHNRAVIIDIVPKGARDLRLAGDLLGQPKAIRKAQERAIEQGLVFPDIFDCEPADAAGIDGEADEVYLEIMDLFGGSALAWFYGAGMGTVGLGTYENEHGKSISRTLIIKMGDEERAAKADELKATGQWSPKWDGAYKSVQFHVYLLDGYKLEHIASESTFDAASAHAQDIADNYADRTLSQKKKSWRNKPASDGQKRFAQKLGVWADGISRGLCATLITHKLAEQALKKSGVL